MGQVDPRGVLWRGGVHYLQPPPQGCEAGQPALHDVAAAFRALASSGDPRQAEAIVAALLVRPDWAPAAADASTKLPAATPARHELLLGYTAAAYLGRHWAPLLELYLGDGFACVPDLFSAELGLPAATEDPWAARKNVALLAALRQAQDGADFTREYDRVVHHLERQLYAEGALRRASLR